MYNIHIYVCVYMYVIYTYIYIYTYGISSVTYGLSGASKPLTI